MAFSRCKWLPAIQISVIVPALLRVRRIRNQAGTITDIWIAGGHLIREKAMAAEIERRYAPGKRRAIR